MALNQEEMQERFMRFQKLQKQLEQLSEQAQMLNQHQMELDISIHAVEEIGKTAVDKEILTPIADGIFIKATLKDNKKLVVNVGSNTTVEKTVDEVKKLLEQQKEDMTMKIFEAEAIMQGLNEEAMKIYREVEKEQEEKGQ